MSVRAFCDGFPLRHGHTSTTISFHYTRAWRFVHDQFDSGCKTRGGQRDGRLGAFGA